MMLHDTDSDYSLIREQASACAGPAATTRPPAATELALVKRKVRDSKLRNAMPRCLIYFTPFILS